MGLPKVSIIMLNYNSMRIINLVLESLNAVSDLDYPNDKYELILVDNNSTDGSFEKIKEFFENKGNLRKKIIRLNSNLGFTGGNNIGFRARDRESKYVVLLNNDAVPLKESLNVMVEYAEQYSVGGLNGIILRHGESNVIDTAGGYLDELLCSIQVGSGKSPPWIIRKPFYITYADGAYALYNVNSVLRTMGEKLFFPEFFGYGDDNVLGLMLWNRNYRVIAIPVVVAIHNRGSTFGRTSLSPSAYLGERNRIALSHLVNVRHRHRIWLHSFRISLSKIYGKEKEIDRIIIRAHYDGIKLSKILRKNYGLFIDLYKAPILKVSQWEFIRYYIAGTRTKLTRYSEGKIAKLVKKLEVD